MIDDSKKPTGTSRGDRPHTALEAKDDNNRADAVVTNGTRKEHLLPEIMRGNKIPEEGIPDEAAYRLVEQELEADGDPSRK